MFHLFIATFFSEHLVWHFSSLFYACSWHNVHYSESLSEMMANDLAQRLHFNSILSLRLTMLLFGAFKQFLFNRFSKSWSVKIKINKKRCRENKFQFVGFALNFSTKKPLQLPPSKRNNEKEKLKWKVITEIEDERKRERDRFIMEHYLEFSEFQWISNSIKRRKTKR